MLKMSSTWIKRMDGHVWSWTLAIFQRSQCGFEWFDEHKNVGWWSVCSFSIDVEYYRILSVSTHENLDDCWWAASRKLLAGVYCMNSFPFFECGNSPVKLFQSFQIHHVKPNLRSQWTKFYSLSNRQIYFILFGRIKECKISCTQHSLNKFSEYCCDSVRVTFLPVIDLLYTRYCGLKCRPTGLNIYIFKIIFRLT
jgi:hypothetical protein